MRRRKPRTWTVERQQAARLAYEQGASLEETAALLGSSIDRIAQHIRLAGGTIRKRGAPMERNGFWKGGRVTDKSGYVLIKLPDHAERNKSGYVREHRLVMEQVLGRPLKPEEVVHHRNGDPTDNRPENLELFESNACHLAEDLKGRCPKWTEEGRARLQAQWDARKLPPLSAEALEERRIRYNANARASYAQRQAARKQQKP